MSGAKTKAKKQIQLHRLKCFSREKYIFKCLKSKLTMTLCDMTKKIKKTDSASPAKVFEWREIHF